MARLFSILVVFVFSAMSVSCAKPMAALDTTLADAIVWPGGNEKPRIKYMWSLSMVKDAGRGAASRAILGESDRFSSPLDSDALVEPHGVFVDKKGSLYISDTMARRVSVVDLNTMRSHEINRSGNILLGFPVSVVSAADGRIFISDADYGKVGVYDLEGKFTGYLKGDMKRPTGLAIDEQRGVLYIADTWEHMVYRYDLASGKRLGFFGGRGEETGKFNFPIHLAVGPDGILYIVDSLNFRVQIFSPDGEYISSFGEIGDGFGKFDKIKGIAVDSQGHIYVTDSKQDMVKIFDREGRLLLFFGQKGSYYGEFVQPAGIYIDGQDRIYVADALNGRVQAFQFLGGE